MGLFSSIKKAVKKVGRVVTGRGHGQNAPEAPTPAPEIELANPQGEAEEKKETTKKMLKKGKKALKITKENVGTSTGRNIV